MTPDIAANLTAVRERLGAAASRAGRDVDAVTLVGASKTVSASSLEAALDAGLVDLGESRAQELLTKAPRLAGATASRPRWHFIGRLQRNKVAALAPWITRWHSLDSEQLGATVARHAPGARVLVQVNLGAELQKGGCAPRAVPPLVEGLTTLGLRVEGLMTVPPAAGDPRPRFAALRELASGLRLTELSMGMSGDFEVAVEEGATLVRVGTALFGPRTARA